MKILKIIGILYISLSATQFVAQNSSNIEHVINSEVFKKERKIRVFLPDRCVNDSISKFPVIYILDAQSDSFWNMAIGNLGYMVNNYSVMPMIAVGIVSDKRGPEFNPENSELHEHLKNEVFPLIDSNYRTDKFRAVVGHSWGGAFIGNTIFGDERTMFDAYIGISPSFGDVDNIIEKNAKLLLEANLQFKKYLYLSHGTVGGTEIEFGGYVNNIDQLVKSNPNSSLAWESRVFNEYDHWQIVGPSFCDGILSMSRNYFADQKTIEDFSKNNSKDLKSHIDEFNKKQESTFGYIHKGSTGYLNFVANDFRDQNDYKNALVLYHMALSENPNNVKVHVNICDTYDKMGDKSLAKSHFEKTLKLLEDQKDEVSDNYYRDISNWITEKLESYN